MGEAKDRVNTKGGNPNPYAILMALGHDQEAFYERE
jgi:hypothetical protein